MSTKNMKEYLRRNSLVAIVILSLLLVWSLYRQYDLTYKNNYLDALSNVCGNNLKNTSSELYKANGDLNSLKLLNTSLNKSSTSSSCYDPNLPKCNKDAYALGLLKCGH
jgi:hypothetical protein